MQISFLGDISLNDKYIELYRDGVDPFKIFDGYLKKSDFVVGNLECITVGRYGVNENKKPRLTTTADTLNYLTSISLNVACLAQNHIYDHLEDGLAQTIKFLDNNNISHLGAGFTKEEAFKHIILTKNGIDIGLLNYVDFDTNPNIPDGAQVLLNYFNLDKALDEIRGLRRKVSYVVVSLHWGGRVEGGFYPDWNQPKIARLLIDAGANMIVGHHSHTIQPFEVYKGKYIFYSLGNFCFSDYTFEGKFVHMPKRRMITMILTVDFNKEKIIPYLHFYKNCGDRYIPIPRYFFNLRIRNYIFEYILRFKSFWFIYYLIKRKFLPFYLFILRKDIGLFTKLKRILKSVNK